MKLSSILVLSLLLITLSQCLPLNKRDQTTTSSCVNVYDECPEYKNQGLCEQNREYMEQTCPVTCQFCTESENAAAQSSQAFQNNPNYVGAMPGVNQASIPQHTYSKQSGASKKPKEQPSVDNTTEAKEEDEKDVKELKSTDEDDSRPDEEQATNEQTQPSSKHIEKEILKNTERDHEKISKGEESESDINVQRKQDLSSSVDMSGAEESGQYINTDDVTNLIENGFVKSVISSERKSYIHDLLDRHSMRREFNENINYSPERDLAEDDAEEEQEVSGEVEETDAESSGNARAEVSSGNEEKEEKQNNKSEESNKDNKNEKTAAEEDKTENAEKYEDEEQADNGKTKPVQQRSQQKGKNLMENMMENNKLEAYSVTKGKAKQKVPADDSEEVNEENEGEDDSTDVDLDFKETGLDALSGSGDENLHLTLKQTYNKQYDNKDSPAFKILTGNFEKDMLAALGEGSEISDISFSEAEVEGNPKTTGKVRVNFKFTGNYDKLSKIIKSGSINGLLVVKNSLEGPMLDLKEEE